MKFSVLLPTRDRLEYLVYAVESIRRQDYDDWEIVVADNASADDIVGYVTSLGDPRIRYVRSDEVLPVAENWNVALEASTGEYLVMLGDDDCLLQGYFRTMSHLRLEWRDPDLVYTGALLFAYPHVLPDFPNGYLQEYGYAEFLQKSDVPYVLDRATVLELVRASTKFKSRYGYNMQFGCFSRSLVEVISERGPFFQSAFPDYYAMNAMLLMSERVLVYPSQMVAIGITTKSYGYYHANNREREGVTFLGGASEQNGPLTRDGVLPATYINTGWLDAMERLAENFGEEFGLKVDYRRYRFLQTLYMYRQRYIEGAVSATELERFERLLRPWERRFYGTVLRTGLALRQILSPRGRALVRTAIRRIVSPFPAGDRWTPVRQEVHYTTILDVFEQVHPTRLSEGKPTVRSPTSRG